MSLSADIDALLIAAEALSEGRDSHVASSDHHEHPVPAARGRPHMIAFALTPEPDASDYERRCRDQVAKLRRDAGLCSSCGEPPHAGRCRFRWSYIDRKSVGLCTYKGCDQSCSETSVQCDGHAEDAVERQRDHRERTGRTAIVR